MIILDTNVLSEILRPAPNPDVIGWLSEQPRFALFTTSLTQAELLHGVRRMPDGQRKAGLLDAIQGVFSDDLAGQVLSFDSDAADAYANIAATRQAAGRPISQFDAMIAAITFSRGARLATRNTKDFVDCGFAVIDPWAA